MKGPIKSPHFIVTVDVETFLINGEPPPFDINIYGRINGSEYGVNKIMDILEKFSVRATFFVDVYMYHAYGEEKVRSLCRAINQRGHDVQLHAHANWIPNHPHEFVSRYALPEQIKIIAEGKNRLAEWTGMVPVGFRAGAYGLNLDTIKALEETGFIIDSSYFPYHRNCELSGQLGNMYHNKIFTIGSIFEIPVSTYWLVDTPFYKKNSKLDINACSNGEFRNILPKFIQSKINFVVLFLHSFSFLKWKRDYSMVQPDNQAMERLRRTLEFLTQFENADFLTIQEASQIVQFVDGDNPDFTPSVNVSKIIPRIIQRLT
jgi:peptidoglycan/xylan/chitin deacetylase (PgdA/CDA1 family)